MYTEHTYQDWLSVGENEGAKLELMARIIQQYKNSTDFRTALEAHKYFVAENEAVGRKKLLKPQKFTVKVQEQTPSGNTIEREKVITKDVEIDGNRVYSRFFYRILTQETQHLLGNGVTIGEANGSEIKAKLGLRFDTSLQSIGEKALQDGVCWGYWNLDHIEQIDAVKDARSGFVALVDEQSSVPMLGLQFWQLSDNRPMYVRLFETDGVTVYRTDENAELKEHVAKRPYVLRVIEDDLGQQVAGSENWGGVLPVIPLYANPERRSELSNDLKSKIDAYDRIASDFVDNLDRANDIYWVLNNFGGNMSEVAQMVEQMERLRLVLNISDGVGGGSTAQPHTFEVPYEARKTALELLEKQIYSDTLSLDMKEITGGGLTNVAIRAAMHNLDFKCNRFEWQAFDFVQGVLRLIGIETEQIRFIRQTLVNQSETVQDIATMREDIDQETALRLNPYILEEEIPGIIKRSAAEQYTGSTMPDTEENDDGQADDGGSEDRADDA